MVATRKRKAQEVLRNDNSAAKKRKYVKSKDLQIPKTRLVTRALAKKMNLNKKSLTSRHAANKNKRPKKFSTTTKMKNCNMKTGYPEGTNKDIVVLYDGKMNSEDHESTTESKINILIASPDCSSNCDVGVKVTDLLDEDHIMINEVLDMMEDYGIIEAAERVGAFDNIRADLVTTYDELKSSINLFFEKNAEIEQNKPND